MNHVSQLLNRIETGDPNAAVELLPLVYDELRKLAAARLARESHADSLQLTALVHEAYLRLVEAEKEVNWDSKGHFFAAAASAMRRILVENARRKNALKRGAQFKRLDVNLDDIASGTREFDHVALDSALHKLAVQHPRKAKLIDLRFYGGLTMKESAAALGISLNVAELDWKFARAWLLEAIRKEASDEERRSQKT